MAKEKENKVNNCPDCDLDALEAANKYMENCRNHLRDVMKPAEKAAKDLENATATDKVRLQGTKETKAPNLKPYTESIPAKNRYEIGKLISAAKAEGRPWKIGRCDESLEADGYRYVFYTTKKENIVAFNENNSYNKKTRLTLSEDVDLVPTEDAAEEEPISIDVGGASASDAALELDEPEDKPLTALDVLKAKLDIHGKDGKVFVALKGTLDDEDACKLEFDANDDEFEALFAEFHEEEPEEPASEDKPEEDDELDEEKLQERGLYYTGQCLNANNEKIGSIVGLNREELIKNANNFLAKNKDATAVELLYFGKKFDTVTREGLQEGECKGPHCDPRERALELHNKRMCKDGKCEPEAKEELIINEAAQISLDDLKLFKPWGGAKDVWELILAEDKLDDLDKALEDMYPDGLKASELNELLWFESDWIIDALDIDPTALAKASEEDIIDGEVEITDVTPEEDSDEEK